MRYEFYAFFCEKFNGLLWYVCFQIKHIKMYWGMNLMPLFGEKFNALLWYVCSQIKYIEIWIKYFVVISLFPNKIYKGVCSQIKYV